MRSPATTETRQTRRSDGVKSLVRMYYDAVMREIYVTVNYVFTAGGKAPLVHCILVVFLTLQTDNIEITKSQASSRPSQLPKSLYHTRSAHSRTLQFY